MRPNGRLSARLPIVALVCLISACAGPSPGGTGGGSSPPSSNPTAAATAVPAATPTSTAAATPTPGPTPRIAGSADLVAYQATRKGAWFSVPLSELPRAGGQPTETYEIGPAPVANRDDGRVSPALVASYVFLQFDHISVADLQKNAATIKALFIRSSKMSFVDYGNGRVLGWDGKSVAIPLDVRGLVRACNQLGIPVFLEINYSDYVAGKVGTGLASLVKTDNIANTITYLDSLKGQGLHLEGVTFGDEWGDESGFGIRQPTLANTDFVGRFIAYATALKQHYPTLKVYAFDSSIGAASGELGQYWDPLTRIRAAEQTAGTALLDGFSFRESYVYIDASGHLRPSQEILDDTESLYRKAPVYRYDTDGSTGSNPDRDYLHTLIDMTQATFGRRIDIALTEYLPAGPTQISESDTSRYADIDFILHYADVVGIYADLGLDGISTYTFANSNQQNKAYIDRFGNKGPDYPVRAQLAQSVAGQALAVRGSGGTDSRVKVYAFKNEGGYFVLILNKDASAAHTVRVTLAGELDVTLQVPSRSYSSLIVNGAGVAVSGIGG